MDVVGRVLVDPAFDASTICPSHVTLYGSILFLARRFYHVINFGYHAHSCLGLFPFFSLSCAHVCLAPKACKFETESIMSARATSQGVMREWDGVFMEI
jgi:hypothetical protein